MSSEKLPIQGIIGIVGSSAEEVGLALEFGLGCLEVRADLLIDGGWRQEEVLEIIRRIRASNLNCLFTLRRFDHGGKFSGAEAERVDFCVRACQAGAQVVDVEWDSSSAHELITGGIPTILSYHDFHDSPSPDKLEQLTDEMLAMNPAGLKIVPTAASLSDSVQMLQWVAAQRDGPPRIGFAMGAAGACSRILTTVFGGLITYASFGEPVAPGQVSIDALKSVYRLDQINDQTRLIGLLGDPAQNRVWAEHIARSDWARQQNWIGVPLIVERRQELIDAAEFLRLGMVIVDNQVAADTLKLSSRELSAAGTFQVFDIGSAAMPGLGNNRSAEMTDLLALV